MCARRYHEDHIAGKGLNSLSHKNLVQKYIPMPQALKIPDAKAAVEKMEEKLEKIPAWQLTKVRNKNEVIAEAKNKGITVHFAIGLPCRPKPIRTISGFLELICRFEFEVCRCGNFFFEGFEFLVRSCECAVACLYPRNSISNVVAFVTIHDDMFIYI